MTNNLTDMKYIYLKIRITTFNDVIATKKIGKHSL